MLERLKILLIASECVPFVKTGGLADVTGALPRALKRMGHDVRVVIPRYSQIDGSHFSLKLALPSMGVWMGTNQEWCSVYSTELDGVTFYFIESEKYFKRWGLYHDAACNDYLDNPRRFGFLTRAGLQICRELDYNPDVLHVHDWHTALGAAYLKIWHWNDPHLASTASLLTIHNLAYQGVYPADSYDYLGLQWGNFTADKFEDHGKINFLKGGIVYADMVNTVSPGYARETCSPEGGFGLTPFLNAKGNRYTGILNGVDYAVWNPAVDRLIPANYTPVDLAGKAACKRALQERFGLDVAPGVPLIGAISRFAPQKGLDILAQAIDPVLGNMQVQFAVLGAGESGLEHFYGELPSRRPGRVGSYIGYNEELAHLIEAGSDFFIMPSQYEPCGLNQIYSLKYGTLPIVRATGGLDDTVAQYSEANGSGTGFKFWSNDVNAIYYTVGWAVSTYYDRPYHIQQMIQEAMRQDFSWEKSARAYVDAYLRAIKVKMASLGANG